MDPKTYEPAQPPLITQLQPVQMPLLPQVSWVLLLRRPYKNVNDLPMFTFSMLLQAEHQKVVFGYVDSPTRLV